MFDTLPRTFNKMPFGNVCGGLFFLMLFFAGWTSSISMAEPLVVILREKFNISRVRASVIVGTTTLALGVLALLSFNKLEDFCICSKYTIFSVMTDVTTNILLPIGALGYAIFAGWKLVRIGCTVSTLGRMFLN
jgi:NSS family neurotransmitter:Na+ symporter